MNKLLTIAIIIVILWAVGFFALPGGRSVDKYTACDCSNLSSRLAIDRQKVMEINYTPFLLGFNPNRKIIEWLNSKV